MAKVYPQTLLSSSSSSSSSYAAASPMMGLASRREIFTIWMKSLVMNGNGCTVYDAAGQLVYRVDNYDCKSSNKVYLMGHNGKTLMKIIRKKLRLLGRWEGFRCSESVIEEQKPWFRVRKGCRINLKRYHPCETIITVGCGSVYPTCYKIEGISAHKSEYRIRDIAGGLMAEVKQKHSASGVSLGDDVLTLVVESNVDRLFIMGLVIVCSLISHRM